jgi:predicted restriction endonuclease
MNYWWVSHRATVNEETSAGFLWRPKTSVSGKFWRPYENIKLLEEGDIIFSYSNAQIRHLGIVQSKAIESIRPENHDFLNEYGWYIKVNFHTLSGKLRIKPKNHLENFKKYLPKKYSPINKKGYSTLNFLTKMPINFVNQLCTLRPEYNEIIHCLINNIPIDYENEQSKEIERLIKNKSISSTTRHQLIKSRLGQGTFRRNVNKIEKRCRITKVCDINHLIASHIKPWHISTNDERLDGNNGLLLAPHIDHLFDEGYISFANNGQLMVSSKLDLNIIKQWGLELNVNVGKFNSAQKSYLAYHREKVFKK